MHAQALVIEDHFIQKAVVGIAQRAALFPALDLERIIVESQAFHPCVGRHCVNAFFPAGAEELERRVKVQFRIVEFRNRRGPHQVAAVDDHWIIVGGLDFSQARDVFVELHAHQAVIGHRMILARHFLAWFEPAQRFRNRYLVDHDLAGRQRRLGNPVAGLDQRCGGGFFGGRHTGGAAEEAPDVDRVGGVVGTLVDHFQDIGATDDGCGDLNAAGAPAVRQRHFAPAERYLVTRDGNGLQDRAADHALGLLVEVGKVVTLLRLGCGQYLGSVCFTEHFGSRHQAAFCAAGSAGSPSATGLSVGGVAATAVVLARACAARRRLRTSASSDWKST